MSFKEEVYMIWLFKFISNQFKSIFFQEIQDAGVCPDPRKPKNKKRQHTSPKKDNKIIEHH